MRYFSQNLGLVYLIEEGALANISFKIIYKIRKRTSSLNLRYKTLLKANANRIFHQYFCKSPLPSE